KATLVISAGSAVNPDSSGRASPVVVRLYQLKTDSAFTGATFFTLFDDERKTLGPDLISRDEYELVPGERRTVELTVSPELHFLAALAPFHDVRNSSWRAVQPVPHPGLANGHVEVLADQTTLRLVLGH